MKNTLPDLCRGNPRDLAPHPRLKAVANRRIPPHHFWVGVDEEPGTCPAAG